MYWYPPQFICTGLQYNPIIVNGNGFRDLYLLQIPCLVFLHIIKNSVKKCWMQIRRCNVFQLAILQFSFVLHLWKPDTKLQCSVLLLFFNVLTLPFRQHTIRTKQMFRVLNFFNTHVDKSEILLTRDGPWSSYCSFDDVSSWYINPVVPSPAGPSHELVHPLTRRGLNFPEKNCNLLNRTYTDVGDEILIS